MFHQTLFWRQEVTDFCAFDGCAYLYSPGLIDPELPVKT
jgi:hypothetical protein